MKKGNPEIEELLNSNTPKYSQSFMVAGGVTMHCIGKRIFVSGNQDKYAYEKMLWFYEEDIKFLKSKCKEDIIFQQDGAPNHTSDVAMKFI